MSRKRQSKFEYRGLAICRDNNFCCQTPDSCAQCEAREELGCKYAIITIEFLPIKEGSDKSSFVEGASRLNRELDKTTRTTKSLTRQMKNVGKSLERLKRVRR